MRIKKNQQGVTMVGLMFLALVIGAFSLVGIKLFPVYFENAQIVGAMEGIYEQSQNESMTIQSVKKGLSSRFSIENIRGIEVDDVDIEIRGDAISLYVNYEVRTTLFANIDLVVAFEEEVGSID